MLYCNIKYIWNDKYHKESIFCFSSRWRNSVEYAAVRSPAQLLLSELSNFLSKLHVLPAIGIFPNHQSKSSSSLLVFPEDRHEALSCVLRSRKEVDNNRAGRGEVKNRGRRSKTRRARDGIKHVSQEEEGSGAWRLWGFTSCHMKNQSPWRPNKLLPQNIPKVTRSHSHSLASLPNSPRVTALPASPRKRSWFKNI